MNNTQTKPDTAKATRMSRALLDEGYSKEYVTKALTDKGYSLKEADQILNAGNQRVLDDKLKTNRKGLIGIGFAWVIAIVSYYLTDHPEGPGWLAQRAFLTLVGISIIFGIRQIVLFVKSANNEMSGKNSRK